jgi:hypothetical protein
MIVYRRCRWAGVVEDLSWGACPGPKFAEFELWLRRAAWGTLLGVLAYLAVRGSIV